MWVIGDVHGCLKTLKKLVSSLPEKKNICFVGDLIDRGPDSCGVIEYVKENGWDCVLGNHEIFMAQECEDAIERRTSGSIFRNDWQKNGGNETLNSYKDKEYLIEEHIEWIKGLPYYKIYDIKDSKGRKLIVSHSCMLHLSFLDGNFKEEILWNRTIPYKEKIQYKEFFNIYGHTPNHMIENHINELFSLGLLKEERKILTQYMNEKVFMNEDVGFANIDTGCVYEKYLTAMHFPSLNVVKVKKEE